MAALLEMIRRQWRDIQTYVPAIRETKFRAFNLATEVVGLKADQEIKLLGRMKHCELAIDVGGNWGQSVYALRKFARPRKIVTFEPNPVLAAFLQRSFGGSPDVTVENVALGEAAGELMLHVPKYRRFTYDGLASLDRASAMEWLNDERVARFDRRHLTLDSYPVRVATLDEFTFSPDVIKIDVQGLETAVAKGGVQTMLRNRPVMIVEAPTDEFVELVATAGLEPYRWTGHQLLAGDLSGSNTVFLSAERKAALGF